jgi:hypothetical protein
MDTGSEFLPPKHLCPDYLILCGICRYLGYAASALSSDNANQLEQLSVAANTLVLKIPTGSGGPEEPSSDILCLTVMPSWGSSTSIGLERCNPSHPAPTQLWAYDPESRQLSGYPWDNCATNKGGVGEDLWRFDLCSGGKASYPTASVWELTDGMLRASNPGENKTMYCAVYDATMPMKLGSVLCKNVPSDAAQWLVGGECPWCGRS